MKGGVFQLLIHNNVIYGSKSSKIHSVIKLRFSPVKRDVLLYNIVYDGRIVKSIISAKYA